MKNGFVKNILWSLLSMSAVSVSAEVAVTRDVDYLPDSAYANLRHRLDIHIPQPGKNVPIVLFFHGGALLYGDKVQADDLAMRLAPMGIGVVSANYRFSPGVQHPAHVQDAAAAFAWVIKNIADYGGDPSNVFVAGHSAGAYLAALLAVDSKYLAQHKLTAQQISGAILISPFLYVEETAKERPKTVWGERAEDWLAASVTPYIGANKPAALLIYADGDELWRKDQNERFAAALNALPNNSATVIEQPNRVHADLIARLNEADDVIGEHIQRFIEAQK